MNRNGHAASLEPHRDGNTFAVKHGLYSRTGRVLAPRAEELAEDLLQRPHLLPLDSVVAEEIGSLLAALEAIDHDLTARAGVPWATFHTLRHTCATLLFRDGKNAKQVQGWLGHHAASFTMDTYVHLLPDGLGEAGLLRPAGGCLACEANS